MTWESVVPGTPGEEVRSGWERDSLVVELVVEEGVKDRWEGPVRQGPSTRKDRGGEEGGPGRGGRGGFSVTTKVTDGG